MKNTVASEAAPCAVTRAHPPLVGSRRVAAAILLPCLLLLVGLLAVAAPRDALAPDAAQGVSPARELREPYALPTVIEMSAPMWCAT